MVAAAIRAAIPTGQRTSDTARLTGSPTPAASPIEENTGPAKSTALKATISVNITATVRASRVSMPRSQGWPRSVGPCPPPTFPSGCARGPAASTAASPDRLVLLHHPECLVQLDAVQAPGEGPEQVAVAGAEQEQVVLSGPLELRLEGEPGATWELDRVGAGKGNRRRLCGHPLHPDRPFAALRGVVDAGHQV